MLLLKLGLLIFVGALNFIVGLAVLSRNFRKALNIAFFGLAFGCAIWVFGIAAFMATHDASLALDWARLYYIAPLALVASSVIFADVFPGGGSPRRLKMYLILAGFVALSVPIAFSSHFLFGRLVYHPWGKEIVLNNVQYTLYSIYLSSAFALTLGPLYRKLRVAKGIYHTQVSIFFNGYVVSSAIGVFFNLVLPGFGNYQLIWLGPLASCIYIVATAYGIIRHKMFDVRLVVARSITYLASLVTIAALYGAIFFGLAQVSFGVHLSGKLQIVLSGGTGLAALTFPRLKKWFDKTTNRFFYRDAYDPQAFFDELNRVLVSTIELGVLLDRTANTIATHLKAQYVLIGIRDGEDGDGQRIFGTVQKTFSKAEISQVRRITPHMPVPVIITDDLPKEYEQLRRLLLKNDIAVLVRVTTDYNSGKEGLGYVALGSKKSGNPYTNQDGAVLAAVANELVIAIQNALRFEEIEKFNETLQQKIEDATRKLRNTNEKLRKLDETKDDFISMASHQLRTPLTSIKGYTSMVLEGDAGKITPLQRKLLDQAFTSSQRMVYLISDLLNVSRLRTGKFIIEPVPTNIATMIHDEIQQLAETAKGRNLELIYRQPAHFPTYMLDETKLRQVIMNFIDNAIYYTPSGGHITINLVEKPQSIEFTVVDDGIGVPKNEQHHLFTKFYRANNAKRARPDGTGLGLFMAKKVIVAQGGAIIFRSQMGKGSTFGFSFAKSHLQVPASSKA
jgi:signal transduction histidine kinase